MKIKTYFPKFYFISILVISIIYGFFIYFLIWDKQYLYPLVIISIIVIAFNRRIIVYEDKLVIFQSYKKIIIPFDLIKSLGIYIHLPLLSRVSFPAIYVDLEDNKQKNFSHNSYSKKAISEIISYIITKNNSITFDSNIKALVNNEESDIDIYQRKEGKKVIIIMLIVIIIAIVYAKYC